MNGQDPQIEPDADSTDPRAGHLEVAAARRERRMIGVFLSLAGGTVVAGTVFGVLTSDTYPDRSWWWWALLFGAPALCALLLIVGGLAAVRWQRRRGSTTWGRSALYELPTQRQRTALVKAIRRGDPIPAERHDLAVRVAREIASRTWMIWLWAFITVGYGLNALSQDGWLQIVWIALTSVAVWFVGFTVWQARRIRARLQALETAPPDP